MHVQPFMINRSRQSCRVQMLASDGTGWAEVTSPSTRVSRTLDFTPLGMAWVAWRYSICHAVKLAV